MPGQLQAEDFFHDLCACMNREGGPSGHMPVGMMSSKPCRSDRGDKWSADRRQGAKTEAAVEQGSVRACAGLLVCFRVRRQGQSRSSGPCAAVRAERPTLAQ